MHMRRTRIRNEVEICARNLANKTKCMSTNAKKWGNNLRRHAVSTTSAICGQFHAPTVLSLGNRPRYPFDKGLGGTQSRSGPYGEEKNLSLPGIEPRPSSS
jgi:hypothetical protein